MLLDRLQGVHLLQEPAPGRYRFHDLVRAHAAEVAAGAEPEPDRRAAPARLLGPASDLDPPGDPGWRAVDSSLLRKPLAGPAAGLATGVAGGPEEQDDRDQ
ncbi:hypothetical protein [Nonomuraea sp. NPDC049709]|uniref:hypothetical protein n=1 Tax=Nonomuraea sp. NPDC049709 TaxID=3154736 RepID=UPI003428F828